MATPHPTTAPFAAAPITGSVDARIAVVLHRSRGAASWRDLRSAGISARAIRRRLDRGLLHEVLPRTYALMGAQILGFDARCAAAVASTQGHATVLSHVTAASRVGAWRRDRHAVVHVLSCTKWRPSDAAWVRYHSTDALPAEDLELVDGFVQTTLERTCLDLGAVLTRWQLVNVLYEAEFLFGLDLDLLDARNERRARCHGKAVLRNAIADRRAGSAGTRSATEDRLVRLILRAGLPEPMVCNPCATELVEHECDLVWPDLRVIVEVDGVTGHRRSGRRQSDKGRDAHFRALGWTVVRISSETIWQEPEQATMVVARALGSDPRSLSDRIY